MKKQAKQILTDLGFIVSKGEGFGPTDMSAARAALTFRKSDLDDNGKALLRSLVLGLYHSVDALKGSEFSNEAVPKPTLPDTDPALIGDDGEGNLNENDENLDVPQDEPNETTFDTPQDEGFDGEAEPNPSDSDLDETEE